MLNARFQIHSAFEVTEKGVVLAGAIVEGTVRPGMDTVLPNGAAATVDWVEDGDSADRKTLIGMVLANAHRAKDLVATVPPGSLITLAAQEGLLRDRNAPTSEDSSANLATRILKGLTVELPLWLRLAAVGTGLMIGFLGVSLIAPENLVFMTRTILALIFCLYFAAGYFFIVLGFAIVTLARCVIGSHGKPADHPPQSSSRTARSRTNARS